MNRLLCFLFIYAFMSINANAQQVLRERSLSNYRDGEVLSFCHADSDSYMFCGYSFKNYIVINQNGYPCIYIGKVRANGDTVFVKPIYVFDQNPRLLKSNFDTYFIISQAKQPNGLVVKEFLSNGLEIRSTVIPGYYSYIYDATLDQSGNILVSGEYVDPISQQIQMGLMKVSPQGEVLFVSGYCPASFTGYSTGHHIEVMKGNKYFLSGTRGSIISSYELDTNGVELRQKDWYRNKNSYYYTNATALQSTDSSIYLIGWYVFGGLRYYTHKKVNYSGDSIWGFEKPSQGYLMLKTLSDGGGIGIYDSTPSVREFRKIDFHGQRVFYVPLSSPGIYGSRFNDFQSDENGNAILAGWKSIFTNPGQKFNFIKIANIGHPNPLTDTEMTAIKKKPPKKLSYAIPNPTTGIFHVAVMGTGKLWLADSQGKILLEYTKTGGDPVDISLLAPGVYSNTLETAGSFTSGRVVKE